MPQLAIVKDEPDDLRAKLREAIERYNALDARHRIAKETMIRAKMAEDHTSRHVNELKQRLEDAERVAIERYAKALAEAFRAGSKPPGAPALPEANSEALMAARAGLSALHAAASELTAEEQAALQTANGAQAAVDEIVDRIIDQEGRELAERVIATQHAHWAAFDSLAGLIRFDEARTEPQLRELQTHVIDRVDRRRLGIANNALMIEQHNWTAYLNGLTADAERLWRDYRARLQHDADAKLDVE